MKRLNLVVLASGRGSNFKAIQANIDAGRLSAEVKLVLSDHLDAPVLTLANQAQVPALALAPEDYADRAGFDAALLAEICKVDCDLIVLAGYMRVLGEAFIEAAPAPIINIHPSLLPSFPGLHAQGQAVAYGVKVSGCTVHLVNHILDGGAIIAQRAVPVLPGDDEDALAARILPVEHELYSDVIQKIAEGKIQLTGQTVTILG
ncbi:MAG: phosphoribosylglycinamide formyltransferase [Peptococcus niger]|nr:phosphoribosylglycinamide formyltransferase [Clostridiales bacterium]